jgi:hypothetical protein
MLYEPPLHEPVGNHLAVAAKVEEMVRSGELEQALITFQTEIVKQSPEEIGRMKRDPRGQGWSHPSRCIPAVRVCAYRLTPAA